MKVLILSPSLSRRGGGVYEVIRNLGTHLHSRGVEAIAAGVQDDGWENDSADWFPIDARCFPSRFHNSFRYSPDLFQFCKSIADQCDLVHLSSLWSYTSIVAKHLSRSMPLVLTPHGMLEPWALKNSKWKKRMAMLLYESSMLRNVRCLQASTEKELNDIRSSGLKNPVAVIPNGVNLPENCKRNSREKRLLFLGRLHPKKGLEELLQAWSHLGRDELNGWKLCIAGWGTPAHEIQFKNIANELGINETVEFVGPVFRAEKDLLLRSSSAFILPSFSEGLPISVLEAWAYGLPVIMTTHCNLPIGFQRNAALPVTTKPSEIASVLKDLIGSTQESLDEIGWNGRKIVESDFSWDSVAGQMHQLYQWVCDQGEKPSFVYN